MISEEEAKQRAAVEASHRFLTEIHERDGAGAAIEAGVYSVIGAVSYLYAVAEPQDVARFLSRISKDLRGSSQGTLQ